MKVSDTDILWGARSALQKAIRRQDLDLAYTSFNLLWGDKDQRKWLKWRLPSIVIEDAWQMAGELAEFLHACAGEDDEKAWRRFIYRLTVCTKSKDACGLWSVVKNDIVPSDCHNEVNIYSDLFYANSPVDTAEAVHSFIFADSSRELSEYELSAISTMYTRSKMGGMIADRFVCSTGMLLVFLRGLSKSIVSSDVKNKIKEWKSIEGDRKLSTVNLPWYVFDMHTRPGKIAMSIFMKNKAKKYNIPNPDVLDARWFFIESAHIPKTLIQNRDYTKVVRPSALDSIWWETSVKSMLMHHGGESKLSEVVSSWRSGMREDLKGCVEWILEKRR